MDETFTKEDSCAVTIVVSIDHETGPDGLESALAITVEIEGEYLSPKDAKTLATKLWQWSDRIEKANKALTEVIPPRVPQETGK